MISWGISTGLEASPAGSVANYERVGTPSHQNATW
jgi:hypothetical protein